MNLHHNDNGWFTEFDLDDRSAFSLEIRERVFCEQSPYQKIEVYDTVNYGKLMVIDGFIMLSSKDNFIYHEMMAHPVLFTHPNPQRVAIIGGGDCGTLREVLKHPEVQQVTQIDIDEVVTQAAEQYFPELCASNKDPRANLLYVDGIEWIKASEAGSLDVIIIDSTDPIGPGEVLYTADFYQACCSALADNGLFIQQSESPIAHMPLIRNMHHRLLEGGFSQPRTLFFPQPVYPTGWWSAAMSAKQALPLDFRQADVARKSFATQYYNEAIHQAALAQPAFFQEALGIPAV
jgi:spermidine synthase